MFPVPDEVREMLTADAILHRQYRDIGYEITVWVIYWSSRNMVKGYHHPDVCWRNRGFRQDSRDLVPISAGGGTIPVTVREFARESEILRRRPGSSSCTGRRRGSASGRRRTNSRVQAAGDSHDWLGERLSAAKPVAATGRLVVLIGTPVWDDGQVIRTPNARLRDPSSQTRCTGPVPGPHPPGSERVRESETASRKCQVRTM